MRRSAVSILLALAALLTTAAPAGAGLERKKPRLTTPWTQSVSSAHPLPEHPRPQLRRRAWRSLNGHWQFEPRRRGDRPPHSRRLGETILVPFPIQSPLSGIARDVRRAWYRRSFRISPNWRGRRVLLHFGAVTHEAAVWVNGRRAGAHAGSYDAFSIDVTRLLRRRGANVVVVAVRDTGTDGGHPIGKQNNDESDLFYTPSTGIWQSVWLEAVGRAYVQRVDQRTDLERRRQLVTVRVARGRGTRVSVRARDRGRVVARASGRPGTRLELEVPEPKLWSPDRPFLYGLDVEVRRRGRVLDRARSYFGMRTMGLAKVGGVVRPVLNGDFVFQTGTLDQGFWPDGNYTAPGDRALRSDIDLHRRMGFNMIRKHTKLEPQRWYYWADRLGLLVWQDFPSMPLGRTPSRSNRRGFRRELREWVSELGAHPSIVTWIPFNEGWGQFEVERIFKQVRRLDPTRLLQSSGSANCCGATEPANADVRVAHMYPGPWTPPADGRRALVLGEFHGARQRTRGRMWDPRKEPADTVERLPGPAANTRRTRELYALLEEEMRRAGLSATVRCCITDVEDEYSGLVTYDRRRDKLDAGMIRALNEQLISSSRTLTSSQPLEPALPPGSAGVWSFDEGAGRRATDSSGRARHLTLQDGAAWTAGRFGTALAVSGGGRATAAGPLLDTAGDFTVSAWLRFDDAGRFGSAVSQEGTRNAGFSLGVTNTRWAFAMPESDAPTPTIGFGGNCLDGTCAIRASPSYSDARGRAEPGVWRHVVGVRRAGTDSIVLYVNGRVQDSRYLPGAWPALGRFAVGAGNQTGPAPDRFAGAIDQVRVYERALEPAEVGRLHLYESALAPCVTGCNATAPGSGPSAANRLALTGKLRGRGRTTALRLRASIDPPQGRTTAGTRSLALRFGRGLTPSLAPFARCRREALESRGPRACPRGSQIAAAEVLFDVTLVGATIPARTDDVRLFRGARSDQVLVYVHTSARTAPQETTNYLTGRLARDRGRSGPRLSLDFSPVATVQGVDVVIRSVELRFAPAVDRRGRRSALVRATKCPAGGNRLALEGAFLDGTSAAADTRLSC